MFNVTQIEIKYYLFIFFSFGIVYFSLCLCIILFLFSSFQNAHFVVLKCFITILMCWILQNELCKMHENCFLCHFVQTIFLHCISKENGTILMDWNFHFDFNFWHWLRIWWIYRRTVEMGKHRWNANQAHLHNTIFILFFSQVRKP